jgi:Restriction Enzyme Adenine Methylase Associated
MDAQPENAPCAPSDHNAHRQDATGRPTFSGVTLAALIQVGQPPLPLTVVGHVWQRTCMRLQSGLVTPGAGVLTFPYLTKESHLTKEFTADLARDGSVKFNGTRYRSLSSAALAAIHTVRPDRKTVDGWISWRYGGRLLHELRGEFAGPPVTIEARTPIETTGQQERVNKQRPAGASQGFVGGAYLHKGAEMSSWAQDASITPAPLAGVQDYKRRSDQVLLNDVGFV